MPNTPPIPATSFDPSWMPGRSARAITIIYLLALGLVAAFVVASHLVTENIVQRQTSTARIVNMAGRQRMLSQRITRVAEELASGAIDPAQGRAILRTSIEGVEQAEASLIHGNADQGIPPPGTSAIRELYTEPPYDLEYRLREFLGHARAVAAAPVVTPADPNLQSMVTMLETSLLPGLEHAVWQYQQDSEEAIAHLQRVMTTLTCILLLILLLEAVLVYRPLFNRLTRAIQQLLQASTTDVLTHVMNRQTFLQHADAELSRARHTGAPTALVVAAIDDWKRVGERHGAAVGDLALRHFASIAQSRLRTNDRIGRLGMDEFGILLCNTGLDGAVLVADRIRQRLAGSTAALMPDNFRVFITASFGITVSEGAEDMTALLQRAEVQLAAARAAGPNEVRAIEPASCGAVPGGTPDLQDGSVAVPL